MSLTIFTVAMLFILGAAVGSFTSVVIYRLHTKESGILRGRSKCPHCQTKLKPLDLIPIASYLMLRGRCRKCSGEISYMYPLLEFVTGSLFALMFFKFPFINDALQFSMDNLGMYLLFAFYIFVLVFTFFYDFHYMQVSDEILLPAILIALVATLAAPIAPSLKEALFGAAMALVFFGFQILVSKGRWLGAGDLRIGAFMGIILGWKFFLVSLFISYLFGSVVAIAIGLKKKKFENVKIPFAPILVTGTFITIFFGDAILKWYLTGILGF